MTTLHSKSLLYSVTSHTGTLLNRSQFWRIMPIQHQ